MIYTGRFEKRRVVVTGGSRGIGAACVRRFAAEGARVAFIYNRSEKEASELAKETGAFAVQGDVSDPRSISRAMNGAIGLLGGIDVLVNNAGVAQFRLFDEITDGDWDKMIGTDLGGVFRAARSAAPRMISQKSGAIINISSMWGETGASCETHYSAAKAGVIGLTKALAKELGPSGIRVNCVAPGAVATDMNAALDAAAIRGIEEETPLGRLGTPDEIAACIAFLASDDASFVTGAVLSANGGRVI